MRIVVHIGMPKTGTTTLQNSLANSYNFLIKHGVLYPVIKGMNNNHFFLGAIVTGKPGDERTYRGVFDQNDARFEQAQKQFWNGSITRL